VRLPVQFARPRPVAYVRAVVGAVAMAFTLLVLREPLSSPFALFVAAFLIYAVGLAATARGNGKVLQLLRLFADTVCFLIVANHGTPETLWLASLLFLALIGEALVLFGPLEVSVVAIIGAVACAVIRGGAPYRLEPTVLALGILAIPVAAQKRRCAGALKVLERQIEEARQSAEKARELERQRIASDFHDGPLQSFISLQMRLAILRKVLDRNVSAGMQDLEELQGLAQAQVRDLRVFLHSMRPVDVDGSNLVAAARRSAESFQKESGIPVTFMGTQSPVGLPQEMTLEVLQMIREALHNVQKHAGASRVAVAMENTPRGLEISVDDNGHGFNFAGTYSLEELELLRLGPASLKRRARSLNADMLLESRPGRGAGLKFRIPLQ
jgi:signal transduction histidine kinase